MAYVNNFSVVLLVWFVAIDSVGGYLLGTIREYAGWGIVSTGADVGRINVGSCLDRNVAVMHN